MMEQFEGASSVNTTPDFIAEMMMNKKDGKEFTQEYLKARFLSSVGRSLYYARRNAGLTQEQVAERMHTKQSVIARFEADKKGSMSFRRYVDFAIACGMMPRSLTLNPILEPIEALRNEVIARAGSQQAQQASTQEASQTVLQMSFEPVSVSFPSTIQVFTTRSVLHTCPFATLYTSDQESLPTANSANRFLVATLYTSDQESTPTANSANRFLEGLRCGPVGGANLAPVSNLGQSTA